MGSEKLTEEERYEQSMAACKEADSLNRMIGPLILEYSKRMTALADVAGKPLYTCLPRHGDDIIVFSPGINWPEDKARSFSRAPIDEDRSALSTTTKGEGDE